MSKAWWIQVHAADSTDAPTIVMILRKAVARFTVITIYRKHNINRCISVHYPESAQHVFKMALINPRTKHTRLNWIAEPILASMILQVNQTHGKVWKVLHAGAMLCIEVHALLAFALSSTIFVFII